MDGLTKLLMAMVLSIVVLAIICNLINNDLIKLNNRIKVLEQGQR